MSISASPTLLAHGMPVLPSLARTREEAGPLHSPDTADVSRTMLANRLSQGMNVAAIATTTAAVAVGAFALAAALPVAAAAVAAVGGAVVGLALSVSCADRMGWDVFRGLRSVASTIANHFPSLKTYIRPNAEDRRIATQPALSANERADFIGHLQPGDVVLDCTVNSLTFISLLKLFGGKCDYTHAMTYEGHGQILHATGTDGSHRSSLDEALKTANHAIAVRPAYHGDEAQKAVEHAVELLGRPYDWFANMDDKRLGCAEMAYHCLMAGAPESEMTLQKSLGHIYPAPRDFLTLKGGQVVAEVGTEHSFWNQLKSAFRVNG